MLPDGRLAFRGVLEEFAEWWRHGEFLVLTLARVQGTVDERVVGPGQ